MSLLLATIFVLVATSANAQGFFDEAGSKVVKQVNEVTGDEDDIDDVLTVDRISVFWNYDGPILELSSEDPLAATASEQLAISIEEKLGALFSSAGITPGAFSFMFNSDFTFYCTLDGNSVSGNYTLDIFSEMITLNFSAVGDIDLGTMETVLFLSNNDLYLLFPAGQFLELVDAVASASGSSEYGEVKNLVAKHKGLLLGFRLDD